MRNAKKLIKLTLIVSIVTFLSLTVFTVGNLETSHKFSIVIISFDKCESFSRRCLPELDRIIDIQTELTV